MNVTWSSAEKNYQYDMVMWYTDKNGIPRYILFDKVYNKININ